MHLPPRKDSLSIALVDLGIHYFSNFKLNQLKVQQAAVIWHNLFYRQVFRLRKWNQNTFFLREFFIFAKLQHLQWNVRTRSEVPYWFHLNPNNKTDRIQQNWDSTKPEEQQTRTRFCSWSHLKLFLWKKFIDFKLQTKYLWLSDRNTKS